MAITPVPPMTDIPPFPALSDRAAGTYNSKAFAFGTYMADTFNGELLAVAESVQQNATEAESSAAEATFAAATATGQAQAAQAVVGVQAFNAAKAYAAGEVAYSLINAQTYRRIAAGTSSTNPASDQVNWRLLAGNDSNGAFVPVAVPALNIDLSQGNYFTKSISANSTFTFSNTPTGGASFTFRLSLTAAVVVAFPSSVRTPNNLPVQFSANKSYLLMFITDDGGARWRLVAAPNFDL
jgi:hypothetical protein